MHPRADVSSDIEKSSFPLQLEAQQPLLPQWHRVQDAVRGHQGICAIGCMGVLLLLVTSTTLVHTPAIATRAPGYVAQAATFAAAIIQSRVQVVVTRHRPATISYNCLYALGGGEVFDGNFPQSRILSPECLKAYHTYFSGPYHEDVNLAISQAAEYFSNLHTANRSQLIVFDIDETALSNLPEWQQFQLLGVVEGAEARRAWQMKAQAPALKATRSLYNELYRKGFGVTFLTGRHEGSDSRALTAANLEYAGYGKQCAQVDAQMDPCYLQLDMREDSDTRLASIYKPDRRAQLQQKGHVIVGSFGDQWSDLAGTSPAVASFKLPNPMYYIL